MPVKNLQNCLQDSRVAIAKLSAPVYQCVGADSELLEGIRRVSDQLGWSDDKRGCFGNVIAEGDRVLIKPNFVIHFNQGDGGLSPLITHQSIIRLVVNEALKANPAAVTVGDAPIQSCDFAELLRVTELDTWAESLKKIDARFQGIHDYRRTICSYVNGVRRAKEKQQPAENFLLFNLGKDSLLEPLTGENNSFRVTSYDPRLMAKTHSRGNHQYLISREVIEADVVINLPKLKTHKKAGITGALKNLVGINGNKEYLPHHRIGGTANGGDCYPGTDVVKRTLESVLDLQNMTTSPLRGKILATAGKQLDRLLRLKGDEIGVEGAWSGNETVARMTLDLNRILLYGKTDATLGDKIQRRVIHIVDGVIAGQGEGPLAPDELPLGLILAGENASAMDWVGALLLGYDARKIPVLNLSFTNFRWQLTGFEPQQIRILSDWEGELSIDNLVQSAKTQKAILPAGWRDAGA